MFTRHLGCDIATTPMIHADGWNASAGYRANFTFDQADRPLIVQFCGHNPDSLALAAKTVEDVCDAVEINLGCPQPVAKKGRFGAFLMTEEKLLREILSTMTARTTLPVLVKTRIFPTWEQTRAYMLMLQDAGASIITVHGRGQDDKRKGNVAADWEMIKRIKQELKIPVISNGNIRCLDDVKACLVETRADGVMSACGLLANPALFSGRDIPDYQLVEQYVQYAVKYRAMRVEIMKHIFHIARARLRRHTQLGNRLVAWGRTSKELGQFAGDTVGDQAFHVEELHAIVAELRDKSAAEDAVFEATGRKRHKGQGGLAKVHGVGDSEKQDHKKMLCRYFVRGSCYDGESCPDLHITVEGWQQMEGKNAMVGSSGGINQDKLRQAGNKDSNDRETRGSVCGNATMHRAAWEAKTENLSDFSSLASRKQNSNVNSHTGRMYRVMEVMGWNRRGLLVGVCALGLVATIVVWQSDILGIAGDRRQR
eukprot:gb/GEZN01005615.1/.p1 GENE.gb/GEZN01005615.1/~~gb/GEZN01005615.1/.p1  ORF type:complete len:548 (+),score=87.24 gb/GEZN01005615.1/:199-1644(+)